MTGNSTLSNKKYLSVEGKLDAYWSTDGIVWNQISYEEGGGSSPLPQYSSQEWSSTVLKSSAVHLGMWGATMVEFNTTSRNEVRVCRVEYFLLYVILCRIHCVQHCSVLHYATLHLNTLNYIALHCDVLLRTALYVP